MDEGCPALKGGWLDVEGGEDGAEKLMPGAFRAHLLNDECLEGVEILSIGEVFGLSKKLQRLWKHIIKLN